MANTMGMNDTNAVGETQRPLAIVTGASSGIGRALARELAQRGFDLIVAAEDERIHQASVELSNLGVRAQPVRVDLSTYEGVETLYDRARAAGRPIDVVAINAGIGVGGDFVEETDLEDELRLINLNVVSTVHLAKRVARDMAERGKGRILITASIAALMPTPLEAVYGASKAFDLSFAESLRNELKERGVTVTAVLPGPTDTEFFERAGLSDKKVAEEAKKNDPADVAHQAIEALMAGKEKVVAGNVTVKTEGTAAPFMPDDYKAERHRKLAQEPRSDRK